jgi:hypothetical protein
VRFCIVPPVAGLPTYCTGPRRVPGLRREEVALLAGVSVDYYTRPTADPVELASVTDRA